MWCNVNTAATVTLVTAMMTMTMLALAVGGAPLTVDPVPPRGDSKRNPSPAQGAPDRRDKMESAFEGLNRREKMLKMLTALEEVHRSINNTQRITMMSRANVRGSGKKSKAVVSKEVQRATTEPPVDEGGTASPPNDNLPDRHPLGGKGFKKSLPQPPKKPNKRVCFWKYCSQN